MLFYQAVLPLSSQTLNFAARLIRKHRRVTGSRWRVLDPAQQALMTLVYLHKGETFDNLAAARGISRATAWRRCRETITILANGNHSLRKALADKGFQGLAPERVGTPYKGKSVPEWQKEYNREHSS